jgi:hypothetical protein
MLKLSAASIGFGRSPLFVRVSTIQVKSEVIIIERKTNKSEEINEVFVRKDTIVYSLESAIVFDRLLETLLLLLILVSSHQFL